MRSQHRAEVPAKGLVVIHKCLVYVLQLQRARAEMRRCHGLTEPNRFIVVRVLHFSKNCIIAARNSAATPSCCPVLGKVYSLSVELIEKYLPVVQASIWVG